MNLDLMKHVCRQQYVLFHYMSRVYGKSGELLYREPADGVDIFGIESERVVTRLRGSPEKPLDIRTFYKLALGRIYDLTSENTILIGPVRTGEMTSADIHTLIEELDPPRKMQEQMEAFLNDIPVVSLQSLITYISFFSTLLNNAYFAVPDVAAIGLSVNSVAIEKAASIQTYQMKSGELGRRIPAEYEKTLKYYVKNGMTEELKDLRYDDLSASPGKMGPTYMRSLKNSFHVLIAIVSRAAIEGGLDIDEAYSLGDRYSQTVEDCNSYNQLASLSPVIKMDFCRRVKEIQEFHPENPLVIKAIRYINSHVYEKLSASVIADQLAISPSYLSVLFKDNLQCSVPQYINRQKINESKKLLRFTDKPLVEISNILGFSSQSYFQNQFKQIRGITPTEYRELYASAKE